MRSQLLTPLAAALALVLSFQTLAPPLALAHDFEVKGGTEPGPPKDPKDPGGLNQPEQPPINFPSDQGGKVGSGTDPVDIHRGEFVLSRQDLFWPGRGLAVDVTFTYRSRSAYHGPFGYGWDMSYNRRLRKLANNNVVLLAGANRTDEFIADGSGAYTAPAGIYDTLAQQSDGTHTLTSKHGEKQFFDINGVLTRIQDRHGNALTFTYDPAGLLPVSGPSAYFVNQTTGIIARDYRLIRITDTIGRMVDFAYDAGGHLVTLTYAGRTITYGYDPSGSGDLVSVTTPATPEFPLGNTTRYGYANHNLTTITDPKGQTFLTNVYDAATDRVMEQTYGAGTSRLAYTAPPVCPSTPGSGQAGYMLKLSPLAINPGSPLTATWTVPAERATHPSDRIALYRQGKPNTSYVTLFSVGGVTSGTKTITTSASLAAGVYETRYLLDGGYTSTASSNTVCVGAAPLVPGPVTSTEMTDRNGFRTRFEFDAAGRITRMEELTDGAPAGEPASYVTTYEYNAAGERTRIVWPRGNATEFTYDPKGNLLQIRHKKIGMPQGVNDSTDLVTTFTYESNFNFIKTVTDPRGHVTTYTYDYELGESPKGNLRRITQPTVGAVTPQTTFTYNSFGQVETVTDPTGHVTKYVYDTATGSPLQITEALGTSVAATTTFTYDAVGNIASLKDPRGNITTFTYNTLNQLIKTTAPSPFGFLTHYTYDANGNLIHMDRQAKTSAPGPRPPIGTVSPSDDWQTIVYTYTALDQLASIKDDLGHVTQFGYDATGNRTRITDAKNQATVSTYDERNLLWKVTDAATPPGITEHTYDANENLAALKDAKGNTTTYGYDDFDRLTRLVYPGGAQETFGYDAGSNLTSRINARSHTLTYTYDALNRLTQKVIPGETTTYTYDAADRLLTAANAAGSISHAYDAQGRLTTVTFPGTKTVSYTYDAADNRTKLTYPGGAAVTAAYDQLNRLTTLTDINAQTISFVYDALSRRTTLTCPNGVGTTYTYDAVNRLAGLTHAKGTTTLASFTYGYDALGNRTAITDAAGSHTLTYDALSQLTSATTPAVSYGYDALGNRTTVAGQIYTTNPLNQYTQVGTAGYTYDADGNLTADGSATYTYNAENQLTQVVKGTTTVTFTYDAFGRRASKNVNGVVTKFLYDGAELLAETNAAGTLTALYVAGPELDEPLELKRGPTTSYYAADGLGSIAHLTNSAGTLVERYAYDPYGQPTIKNAAGTVLATSALQNPFLFTGREWDSETGLYFYRARYYQPKIGRFLSRDPLGYAPDSNLYRYVGNNPTTWTDPWGLLSLIYQSGGSLGGGGLWPGPLPPGRGMDFPPPQPAGPHEPTPPPHTPPSQDLWPEHQVPGQGSSEGPRSKSIGGLQGTTQPGINKADKGQEGKKGGRKGKGKDIKQVDDVGKKFGMDKETRREFGRYLEEIKKMMSRGDFSYQELIDKAKEFLGLL